MEFNKDRAKVYFKRKHVGRLFVLIVLLLVKGKMEVMFEDDDGETNENTDR